jgi:hypothetical protein
MRARGFQKKVRENDEKNVSKYHGPKIQNGPKIQKRPKIQRPKIQKRHRPSPQKDALDPEKNGIAEKGARI